MAKKNVKFIGDYPRGTRLSATLLRDPERQGWNQWNDEQRAWLRKYTGKKIQGTVMFRGGAYLRPEGKKVPVVLADDEIRIHRRLPKKRK